MTRLRSNPGRAHGYRGGQALMQACAIGILIAGMAGCKGTSTSETDKTAQNQEAPGTASSSPPASAPPSSETGTTAEAAPPGAKGAPATPVPTSPITPSGPPTQVVATVNGQAITRGEMDFMVKNVMKGQSEAPTNQHAQIRQRVLDEMINKELLYQKAKLADITVTPDELSDTMKRIKSDFRDDKAFAEQLRKDNMSMSGVEAMVRQGLVIDKFLDTSVKVKIKVPPAEEEKFYADNKEMMKHPEQIRASHILLRTGQGATEEMKKAQRAKAEEALSRARKGEDFAALAKQYSQDVQTAANGGDLGFFAKGQMVPAFDTAAWALKPGEISGVVETNFGYHIIKAIERRPEGYTPINDVRARIHEHLVNQHVHDDMQKAITDLRSQAKINVTL